MGRGAGEGSDKSSTNQAFHSSSQESCDGPAAPCRHSEASPTATHDGIHCERRRAHAPWMLSTCCGPEESLCRCLTRGPRARSCHSCPRWQPTAHLATKQRREPCSGQAFGESGALCTRQLERQSRAAGAVQHRQRSAVTDVHVLSWMLTSSCALCMCALAPGYSSSRSARWCPLTPSPDACRQG